MKLKNRLSNDYNRPCRTAMLIQLMLFALPSIAISREPVMAFVLFTSAIFWLMVLAICLNRPEKPTEGDLRFIYRGLIWLGMGALVVGQIVIV
ncbi:MAG: hypothetical protein WCL04_05935 [Verrucomicrobiota bacterium]